MHKYASINILSRLPVKTIIHCKCVCKKWRNIVLDSYFANLHLSRSPEGIMVHHGLLYDEKGSYLPGILKRVEVEDELDHHHLHHDPLMSIDLDLSPNFQKSQICMVGSVDGLLCLWQFSEGKDNTYICNPITREYMILPRPQYWKKHYYATIYCFGVGLMTKEYKVIRISKELMPPNPIMTHTQSLLEAEVYTLGSGQRRSLGHIPYWLSGLYETFLNGHAHLIVANQGASDEKICAFDFDKETFKLFPSPPYEKIEKESQVHSQSLGVLKGCLCLCESYDSKLTIWVMKEYGIKKSWHIEVVMESNISYTDLPLLEGVYVVESFKYGVMVVAFYQEVLWVYCPQRKTFVYEKLFDGCLGGLPYGPSFHRLQNLKNERADVF